MLYVYHRNKLASCFIEKIVRLKKLDGNREEKHDKLMSIEMSRSSMKFQELE